MNDKERYRLWQCTKVRDLSETMSVVKNVYTDRLMIKKISAPENFDVMSRVALISHKNIMQVYDCTLYKGVCMSLCEYVDGITLETAVEYHSTYDEDKAKDIMIQVCSGLAELHKNHIIHRDINPSNVMITRDGTVKIIDFNITRVEKENASKDTTIFGTVGYTAPEQFGFAQTSERSDVYSCGVLLNYLLTGRLPDEKIYYGRLGDIVRVCTQIDSEKRYESAQQLSDVLSGKRFDKERKYRPVPGFRSGKVFPKVITVIGYVLYAVAAVNYIGHIAGYFNRGYQSIGNNMVKINLVSLTLLVFWSAVPYIFIGDIFNLSHYILPKHPGAGKAITKIIGFSSIAVGFYLISLSTYI